MDATQRRSTRVVRPRGLWPVVLAPDLSAPVIERYLERAPIPALAERTKPGGGGRG